MPPPPPPPPPPPRPPPPLVDELVKEVLLRLPPDSPASLVRAGVVCKRWCHLVSNPGFQRGLLDFHRQAPPILGFLIYSDELNYRDIGARFVPTTSDSGGGLPHATHCGWRPCDSRHGRVLLRTYSFFGIIIWNPITGEQLKLPDPPATMPNNINNWTAAVLCAATATTCNHLDCHRHGPFIVVLVGDTTFYEKFTCIYSSEDGLWSEPTAVAPQSMEPTSCWIRSTLVGKKKTLYFVLQGYKSILEYNLCTGRTSVIKLPSSREGRKQNERSERFRRIQFTTMEDDSRLGFVRVDEDYSRLCVWSREEDEEPAGVGWVLSKVIELDKLLLPSCLDDERRRGFGWDLLIGSAEGVGTILLKLKDELFTVDLSRSGDRARATKVYTHQGSFFSQVIVVPYVNFCTPGTSIRRTRRCPNNLCCSST